MTSKLSPFLNPGPIATSDSLAIIHLKRDHQIPTILKDRDDDDDGYVEGKVVNTRFGSFPHRTLIGLPWGSQVRASKVDTGSRGRRNNTKKRKRDDVKTEVGSQLDEDATSAGGKDAVTASSGFIHLLAPTPENWTSSLPHRTQVVYTPDYSYILHRLRARPGTRIIEAGAGSGSFTHASARAVYSGFPAIDEPKLKKRRVGKVFSYEFHEQRHEKLQKEIDDHGLTNLVQITHRDVCRDGFLVDGESLGAEAVFLDLPAPWLALPHLTRRAPSLPIAISSEVAESGTGENGEQKQKVFVSPLNPDVTTRICTFSPCIEQVQRTISTLRQLGWVDISMVEISHKRLDVRRERIGISQTAGRISQAIPSSINEAVERLREVEGRFKSFHGEEGEKKKNTKKPEPVKDNPNTKARILESLVDRKIYKEGRLVHRSEPEIKTHTSYLVFALLPREWSAEDEENARKKWPVKVFQKGVKEEDSGKVVGISKRQIKRDERAAMREQEKQKGESGEGKNGLLSEQEAVQEDIAMRDAE